MKTIEVAGNSVDDAVQQALLKLGVDKDKVKVKVDVLDAGSRGFLGIIGGKQARVRVSVTDTTEEIINKFLRDLIKIFDINVGYKLERQDEYMNVNFEGPDVRILIGRRGETLNALQLIVNLVVNKENDERVKVVLDAEGYRKRREETLRRLARRLSERVRRTKKNIVLEPMTPQERRIIHTELQENPWVYTVSHGEEPYRKVMICLKK